MGATEGDMCSVISTVELDCDPRPTVPPFDPNDESRDKMENPRIPLGASLDLEKYYNYLSMQGKLRIYKYTDHEDERARMKQEITDHAIDQQFVTRFTSMVVVEKRTQRDADKKDIKVRIKHTKEWRDELEKLFQNKALNDILETENTIRIRRSASIGPNSGLSNTRNVLVISFLAIFGLIRFKRTFMALIRLFFK